MPICFQEERFQTIGQLRLIHLPDHGSDHGLDLKVGARNQLREIRILRAEKPAIVHLYQSLQGAFAVDQRDDNLIAARIWVRFGHDEIAIENPRVAHRFSPNLQSKAAGAWFESKGGRIHGDAGVRALLCDLLRRTRRDAPEERQVRDGASQFLHGVNRVNLPRATLAATDTTLRLQGM